MLGVWTEDIGERGTDSGALAAVLGALNTASSSGAISDAKTAMAYLKQVVTRMEEVVIDVTGINGSSIPAMVGTANAFTAADGGVLATAAATGAVGTGTTAMGYLKQAVTRLEEIIIDVTGINGSAIPAMVGTNLALTALVGGALATAAHTGAVDTATTIMGYIKQIIANSENVSQLATHITEIFPSVTNLTCTLTAHANANEWSAYTEIADSAATKLSASFSACDGHITAMVTESADTDDTTYMVEVSYGASHDVISEWRLVSGTSKVSSTGQSSARGAHIPTGENIYSRVMCETAGSKTLTVHFRHFCHV